MKTEGVSHRAMPEQVHHPQPNTATPRDGGKEGRGLSVDGKGGKSISNLLEKKNECSLVWRVQSEGNAEEG